MFTAFTYLGKKYRDFFLINKMMPKDSKMGKISSSAFYFPDKPFLYSGTFLSVVLSIKRGIENSQYDIILDLKKKDISLYTSVIF